MAQGKIKSVALIAAVASVMGAGTGPVWSEPAPTGDALSGSALVTAGGKLFAEYCAQCHSTEASMDGASGPGKSGVGPNLRGIVGRETASLPGYRYSRIMRALDVTWTEKNLKKYLSNPQAMIPCHSYRVKALVQCSGIAMRFPGFRNAADAVAVIAFLKTQ